MSTNDTPLFKSSPERIGLAFGDEEENWEYEFGYHEDVSWYSGHPTVSVTIEYVRADLYENLKAEFESFSDDVGKADRKNLSFAMACVRDEVGITVGGALNRQREMIGELRAELAAANERAEALQRTINEALSQSPAATIVEIDDGLRTTFLEFHEPRGPEGTNYYAAPVPSLPAVVPEEVRKMRETLFDISTSDVLSDRSENTHVTVAIDRDTFRQAAILSTTNTEVKNG